MRDGDLGPAGTLVGTSSLSEADVRHESIHLGSTLYGSRWWGTQVNPESTLLLMTHCFGDCGYGRVPPRPAYPMVLAPSSDSRMMSAWPECCAVSAITCSST